MTNTNLKITYQLYQIVQPLSQLSPCMPSYQMIQLVPLACTTWLAAHPGCNDIVSTVWMAHNHTVYQHDEYTLEELKTKIQPKF
jgi:hypothetical protein